MQKTEMMKRFEKETKTMSWEIDSWGYDCITDEFLDWEQKELAKYQEYQAKATAYDRLMSGGKKAIEETCKAFKISDIGEFSDGFHTFNTLYHQRAVLFATLVNTYSSHSWKSYRHEDGQICFGGGWFIVGIDTPKGSYTYHYENKYWDMFNCQTYENAKHWDGHTDDDVERLLTLPDGWEEE